MFPTMKGLLYPIFGLAVIGGYAWINVTGTDPFAASTERTVGAPAVHAAAAAATVGGTYLGSRRRSAYRYGK